VVAALDMTQAEFGHFKRQFVALLLLAQQLRQIA
jgi:hypothetical protein